MSFRLTALPPLPPVFAGPVAVLTGEVLTPESDAGARPLPLLPPLSSLIALALLRPRVWHLRPVCDGLPCSHMRILLLFGGGWREERGSGAPPANAVLLPQPRLRGAGWCGSPCINAAGCCPLSSFPLVTHCAHARILLLSRSAVHSRVPPCVCVSVRMAVPDKLAALFPATFGKPHVTLVPSSPAPSPPLRIGVVLSGGQVRV